MAGRTKPVQERAHVMGMDPAKKRGCLSQIIYRWELETAIYMMERWEKCLFNSVVIVSVGATSWYSYTLIAPLFA